MPSALHRLSKTELESGKSRWRPGKRHVIAVVRGKSGLNQWLPVGVQIAFAFKTRLPAKPGFHLASIGARKDSRFCPTTAWVC